MTWAARARVALAERVRYFGTLGHGTTNSAASVWELYR